MSGLPNKSDFVGATSTEPVVPSVFRAALGQLWDWLNTFGTVVTRNTGGASDQVPLNSDLGAASKKNVGTGAADLLVKTDIENLIGTLAAKKPLDSVVGTGMALGAFAAVKTTIANGDGYRLPNVAGQEFAYCIRAFSSTHNEAYSVATPAGVGGADQLIFGNYTGVSLRIEGFVWRIK